jgi:glucose/mannose-6-phosphate isomerase
MAGKQILDDASKIRALDKSGMLGNVRSFPLMLGQAVPLASVVRVGSCRGAKGVVICGMGGSAICGDLIRSVLEDKAGIQIVVNRGYTLPKFIRTGYVFFAVSYSGNTEETLSALSEAEARRLNVIAVSSGGRLEAIAKEKGYPHIKVPAGLQPRAALPYLLGAVLVVLENLGLARTSSQIKESISLLEKLSREYSSPTKSNFAKQIALDIRGRVPVVLGSTGITAAASLRFSAQLNENGKVFSHASTLPEMDHNEIVGFSGIGKEKSRFSLLVLRDENDHERIKRRIDITKSLARDSFDRVNEIWSTGKSDLARLLSLVLLGDFVSVYLAILRGVDPTPVAVIETLKRELSK